MKSYETWAGVFLMFAAVVFMVHYFMWRKRFLPDLDEGTMMGDIKGWEIRVVDDPEDGRSVGIAVDLGSVDGIDQRFYAVFSSAQARELAQWLRVAAAPGPTLAAARLNLGKSLK
jgi:hypothetical protein